MGARVLQNEAKIAVRFTLLTTVVLGIAYPLLVTGIGQVTFPRQANGEIITVRGEMVGSALIGQSFAGDQYFHGRPSAAGNGYDAGSSGASNLAPSSQKLISRIEGDVKRYATEGHDAPVPIDLVTASGSGLDPEISPAAAMYQAARVAEARHLSPDTVKQMIERRIQRRQFGLLGEQRVNVLLLNMDLDGKSQADR
jgi:potassium-transporting ATPase KdpC subunit